VLGDPAVQVTVELNDQALGLQDLLGQ